MYMNPHGEEIKPLVFKDYDVRVKQKIFVWYLKKAT